MEQEKTKEGVEGQDDPADINLHRSSKSIHWDEGERSYNSTPLTEVLQQSTERPESDHSRGDVYVITIDLPREECSTRFVA